jgi:hypothetical protein
MQGGGHWEDLIAGSAENVCSPGIAAFLHQKLSRLDGFGPIELEEVFSHSALRCQRDNLAVFEAEVTRPFVLSRVEQAYDLTGLDVDGGNVASLETVARKTGPSKVVLPALTAVFARHDMVYLMREQCVFLVD